nr:hypothetical protein [Tanacetum cinerariifolium]
MKTKKRKLVPKSYPLSGDGNAVSFDVGHHVYDANSNVSPKKQCLGGSNFISSPAIDVSSSGVRNMTNISGAAVPNTYIECETTSHSVIPTNINREYRDITEPNADVTDGGKPDSYYNRSSRAGNYPSVVAIGAQPEYVVSNSNNRSWGRRNRTKRNPPVTSGSSSQQPSSSGPPLEYKYLGGCTHTCQHCGALFWFEEHLKRTSTYSLPRYNRCCRAGRVSLRDNSVLREDILKGLIDLLDGHNALVQLFRTAREKFQDTHVPNFKVRLYNVVGAKEYELPTRDMLGAIVYGTGLESDMDYDVVLEERSGHMPRVNKLHPSYMSLQFLLLFIYDEDGYSKDLKMIGSTNSSSENRVSQCWYIIHITFTVVPTDITTYPGPENYFSNTWSMLFVQLSRIVLIIYVNTKTISGTNTCREFTMRLTEKTMMDLIAVPNSYYRNPLQVRLLSIVSTETHRIL